MSQPSPHSAIRLKVEFAQTSDPGRDPNKQVNEDSCGYAETRLGHLMVLCDGMGGHYGGQEASRTAIATVFELFDQAPAGTSPAVMLKAAIEEAGRRVYLLGGPPENRTRPGSTAVAMLLHDRGVDVAHVGDSRAYVIRGGQIYPLTRDHSMVQGMIDQGMITEEQAIGHPDANKITRALGMRPEVDVELRPEPMELFPGDILLQSSDGLTDLALGADILAATKQALSAGPVQHACNSLVQLANNRGGHDNITVQMVRILEVGPRASTTIPDGPSPAAAPQETVAMTAPDNAGTPAPARAATPAPTAPPHTPPAQTAPPHTPPPHTAPPHTAPPHTAPPHTPVPHTAPPHTPVPNDAPVVNHGPIANQGPIAAPVAGGMGLHGTQVMAAPGGVARPAPAAPSGGQQPGPAPTMNEGHAQNQPWTSAQYNGPPVTPAAAPLPPAAANIAQYKDQSPGALPLPPPSPMRQGFGAAPPMGAQPAHKTPAPTHVSRTMGPRPMSQLPSSSLVGAKPSRGGIVFVIIGLSAVIAVLILVILWALVLR